MSSHGSDAHCRASVIVSIWEVMGPNKQIQLSVQRPEKAQEEGLGIYLEFLRVEPTWEKGETLIRNGPPSTEGQSRARGWRRKSQDTLGGRGRRHLDGEREVRIEIILT